MKKIAFLIAIIVVFATVPAIAAEDNFALTAPDGATIRIVPVNDEIAGVTYEDSNGNGFCTVGQVEGNTITFQMPTANRTITINVATGKITDTVTPPNY
ncbi:MAG: hypothetical protein WC461_02330 [Candidatus Paceibacterota bacterium]